MEQGDGWQLRDRRVRPDYGRVLVNAPEQLEDCMIVSVETADNGPEFYDELANYLIAVLGREQALTVRETGKDETTASAIEEQLPDSPYGLLGLDNLR